MVGEGGHETKRATDAARPRSHHITWELLVADCSGGDEDGWMDAAGGGGAEKFQTKGDGDWYASYYTSNILIQRLPLKASFSLSA